jgi:hypothetical protein
MKTMATVFFKGTGLHLIDILPPKSEDGRRVLCQAYYAVVGFSLFSNRKELPAK